MKTTGYALREAIKQHELRRDTASRVFTSSLKMFEGEVKEHPEEIMGAFLKAEDAIARLQTAQMRYNLSVFVTAQGRTLVLATAIKLLGGIARAEKMWRTATGPKENPYAPYGDDVREMNQIRAKATIKTQDAMKLAATEAKRSAALRQAVAVANATEIEVEGLDGSLFE